MALCKECIWILEVIFYFIDSFLVAVNFRDQLDF